MLSSIVVSIKSYVEMLRVKISASLFGGYSSAPAMGQV